MTTEEALTLVGTLLQPNSLTNVQELVLRQCWQGQTYADIADSAGYDTDYIKFVGCQLWQLLSQALGRKVSKNNIRSVLQRVNTSELDVIDLDVAETKTQNAPTTLEPTTPELSEVPVKQPPIWLQPIEVPVFYGRNSELVNLQKSIITDRCRLVALLGMGGIGKTALAATVVQKTQFDFQHVVWRSLRNAPSIEDTLIELLQFLGSEEPEKFPQTLDAQISQLIHYLRTSRCLIIFDNLESILLSNEQSGRYRKGYEGYGQLLRLIAETHHQSCVLLTSREKPVGFAFKEGEALPVRSLPLKGLEDIDAQKILEVHGIKGNDEQKQVLIRHYLGNPLALKIAATTIQNLFHGQIAEFVGEGTTIFGEIRDLLEQQFNRLSELEKGILCALGRQREPMSISQIQAMIQPQPSKANLLEALMSLERRSLLNSNAARFSIPALLTEYITDYGLGEPEETFPQLSLIDNYPLPQQVNTPNTVWLPQLRQRG